MKVILNIFYSVVCLVAINTGVSAQTTFYVSPEGKNTDTVKKVYSPIADSLGYIKEILANKDKYVNKEFSVLLNDLKIPIKSYTAIPLHNKTLTKSITISFDDSKTTYFKKYGGGGRPLRLQITWDKPISTVEIYALKKKGLGEWTSAETEYFSKLRVADIW